MNSYKEGIHQPTTVLPQLFVYPTLEECRLVAEGAFSNASGCPLHTGCSCSHGLESYVCEFGIACK